MHRIHFFLKFFGRSSEPIGGVGLGTLVFILRGHVHETTFHSIPIIYIYMLGFFAQSCVDNKSKLNLATPSPSSSLAAESLSPISAKPGDIVKLTGQGFSSGQSASVTLTGLNNVTQTTTVKIIGATEGSFVMPEGLGLGLKFVAVTVNGKELTGTLRIVADSAENSLPILIIDQSEVCSTLQYIDKNGDTQTGTKDCGGSAIEECSTNGVIGCKTTSTYKSADLTNLTEGNIKNGVTIAGVAGLYPNSTYTLPSASGTADLDAATFNAKVKSATAFEYWDSSGARQTGAGDADITAGNISSGVDIFGTTGTLTGGSAPNAWDVRAGTVVNGVTGKLKVNCRNTANSSIYNYDGAVGSLGTSGVTTGTTVDLWDTIDDYNNAETSPLLPASTVSGWSSATNCGGYSSTASDDNVWLDVTTTTAGAASTCAADSARCTYQDKISGLWWSKLQSTGQAWNVAVQTCDGLNFNGQTDWRLPTQKELISAYEHGIRATESPDFVSDFLGNYFWSASTRSDNIAAAWYANLSYGSTTFNLSSSKTASYYVICVR